VFETWVEYFTAKGPKVKEGRRGRCGYEFPRQNLISLQY
jgi:hypothetical protein